MADESNKKENGKTCACGCGSCGCTGMWRWGGGHMLVRVVIGLLILCVVFWIGMKVGEFHSALFGSRFGGHDGYIRNYPMMRGGYGGYGSGSGGAMPPLPAQSVPVMGGATSTLK